MARSTRADRRRTAPTTSSSASFGVKSRPMTDATATPTSTVSSRSRPSAKIWPGFAVSSSATMEAE